MSGRRLREVSVMLGLVLMVMLGAIIVVFVSSPGLRPAASPTPTTAAGVPTVATTIQPLTATPTLLPTEPATDTPSGGPTAAPTDSPPPAAVAPTREISFTLLGLDTTDIADEDPQARYFTFTVDGPGRIEVNVTDVSFGRVRMCLWQGDPTNVRDNECQTVRGGSLGREAPAGGATAWTLSLIGSQAGASPSATVTIRWPTADAKMHLSGFRFQGQAIDNYNGFVAEVDLAASGPIAIDATFDDGFGGSYPYRLIVEEIGGGPAQSFVSEGEGPGITASTDGTAERSYRITLENRQDVADQRVLLTTDLDWP